MAQSQKPVYTKLYVLHGTSWRKTYPRMDLKPQPKFNRSLRQGTADG